MIGFGEIALLLNDRRTATVSAASKEGCDTWVLSADVFKYIIASNTIKRRHINLSYLSQVELFKNIEQYEKIKLLDGLKIENYKKEEFVFREGDVGNNFYIIEEGECECLKD
jgi:cAMP-dependent protein kinase regulator